MKVGIVTVYDSNNIGNRLQNYALQQYLLRYAEEVVTLKNRSSRGSALENWKRSSFLEDSPWYLRLRGRKRQALLAAFSKRYIHTGGTYWYNKPCGGLRERDRCDLYCAGSDQVWNPDFGRGEMFNYLGFAERESTFSYAASFGVEQIPPESEENVRRGLSHIRFLSVREEAGKHIAEDLTGRTDVQVLVDPTLLLTAGEWDAIARRPRGVLPGKYVLTYFLGALSPARKAAIAEKAAEMDCAVVDAMDGAVGPEEFLYLIAHAALVCTDSFHGSVFSFLYGRALVIFPRPGGESMNSRLETLVKKFSLGSCLVRNDTIPANTDYSAGYAALEEERKKSKAFFDRVFWGKACCGCGACAQACPKNAITMAADKEGFLYPVVDEGRCVNCRICRNACPMRNTEVAENRAVTAHAAWAKDGGIREKSSSGGVFSLLALWTLERRGVVFGAAFDGDFSVCHTGIETESALHRLRGSKYVQSRIGNTFRQAKTALEAGKTVLFSGTPCQIGGLQRYLGREYEKLYTVDVLCHGVSSPMIWEKYLKEQRTRFGSGLEGVSFRAKNTGWKDFSMEMRFKNGEIYSRSHREDPFMKLFLGNICLRPSCHRCPFKALPHGSDLTIGDAWGIGGRMPDMDDGRGTSVVLVNSEKGAALWEAVRSGVTARQGEADTLVPQEADARRPVKAHGKRAAFFAAAAAGETVTSLVHLLRKPLWQKIPAAIGRLAKKRFG